MKIGLALPHFSDVSTPERLLGSIERIEDFGFDGVWVRDHFAFEAKTFDPPGNRFIDPFVTLSAVASRTTRLTLGFAVIIPNRHPLRAVHMISCLDWLSGGRVELGLGVGAFGKQFEAVDIGSRQRVDYCEDMLGLIRSSPADGPQSFAGRAIQFDHLHLEPAVRADLTIWYGSLSPPALTRAVAHCDGVLAARCTFDGYSDALAKGVAAGVEGIQHLAKATEPLLVIAKDDRTARTMFEQRYPFGPDDDHDPDALAGAVIVGGPEQCVEQLHRFRAGGFASVILDTRLCMGEFDQVVDLLGREVLPELR
jgi:alkanesulfonate monooxygenase SsuD/methylene tetrahydromethanopterin reductase-like flavin-dependent oxidoreductase (luciferase family)